jgi:hypothetical protein
LIEEFGLPGYHLDPDSLFPAIRDVHDFELAAHAVGHNLRRVLAWLRALLRQILIAIGSLFIIRSALKPVVNGRLLGRLLPVRSISRSLRQRSANLYSMTTNRAAIIALFRVINRNIGNLSPMRRCFRTGCSSRT